jgi:hypothetical protein
MVFLASLEAIIPAVLCDIIGEPVALAIGITVNVMLMIVISLVSSALNAIVLGAIYLYAADGTVPDQFDKSLLQHAFVRK